MRARSSSSIRNRAGTSYPNSFRSFFSIFPATAFLSFSGDSKITLPLWMKVLTFLSFRERNISVRASIFTTRPPTLIPRRKA